MLSTGIALAAVCCALVACGITPAAAQGAKVRVFGDRQLHPNSPKDFMRTYVDMPKDHDGSTLPLAAGIQITYGFTGKVEELPPNPESVVISQDRLGQPPFILIEHTSLEPVSMPQVGRTPFTFMTWYYAFSGYPPRGFLDYSHYTFRLFMVPEDYWAGQVYPMDDVPDPDENPCFTGTPEQFYQANMPLPQECYPSESDVPTLTGGRFNEGFMNVGAYNWGVGSPLYNFGSNSFTHPERKVVDMFSMAVQGGEVVSLSASISPSLMAANRTTVCQDISQWLPAHFETERYVPTEMCYVPGNAAFKIEFRKFKVFPGGCKEFRNTTKKLLGYYPDASWTTLPAECRVPLRPLADSR